MKIVKNGISLKKNKYGNFTLSVYVYGVCVALYNRVEKEQWTNAIRKVLKAENCQWIHYDIYMSLLNESHFQLRYSFYWVLE